MTSYTARALSTDRLQHIVHQVAHAFVIGDVLRFDGAAYVKAQADNLVHSETVGMVSFVIDADNFVLTQAGYIINIANASAPFVAGTLYYLDTAIAGKVVSTAPAVVGQVKVPLLIADSTSSGWYFNNAGQIIESGAFFAWTVVGINTAMAINNGYMTASGGTLNMTLPTVCAIGDLIRITNLSGQFHIVQGAGQSINFGNDVTTVGAGGSITSTAVGDSIELVCYNANVGFQTLSSMGNLTFV